MCFRMSDPISLCCFLSLLHPSARSAFKLLQIARHFDILRGVTRVVDLCAAPGGWTEVISEQLVTDETDESVRSRIHIVAVDLQAMAPLPGVHFIQGDLTRDSTAALIREALGQEETNDSSNNTGNIDNPSSNNNSSTSTTSASTSSSSLSVHPALAELVVCDGAPDVIGMHDIDEAIQFELLLAALNLSLHILRDDGTFVAKIFRGKDVEKMYSLFTQYFHMVTISKPKACRNSSIEGFIVCQGFKGLKDEVRRRGLEHKVTLEEARPLTQPITFVSVWDEEGLDSDRSYPLSYTFKTEPTNRAKQQIAAAAAAAALTNASTTTTTSSTSSSSSSSAAFSTPALPSTYHNLTPSALPIDPPYKRSLQMKRQNMFQKQ